MNPETNMSDTPRTDVAEYGLEVFGFTVVSAAFARILELENTVLREDKARLDWLESLRCGVSLYYDMKKLDSAANLRSQIDDLRRLYQK